MQVPAKNTRYRLPRITPRHIVMLVKGFWSRKYMYQRSAILLQLIAIMIIEAVAASGLYSRADYVILEAGLSAVVASPLILIFMAPHANLIHMGLYMASAILSYYTGLLYYYPVHGIAVAASLAAISPRLEFTLDAPTVESAISRGFSLLKKTVRKSAAPYSFKELKERAADNILTIVSLVVSIAALGITRNPVLSISLIFSMILVFTMVFGLFMSPGPLEMRFAGGRGLLRIYRNFSRYRGLYTLAERTGKMISEKIETAGLSVDPVFYAAKYLSYSILLLSASPTIYVLILMTSPSAYAIAPLAFALPVIPFLLLRLSVSMAISSRRSRLEKVYPFFTIFSAVMIINGVRDIEKIFESFTKTSGARASELLPALEKEALILLRYIRIMGLTPLSAIDRYITYCPSESMRSYMRGYVNQLSIGTPLKDFAIRTVSESLEILKRRLEGLGAALNTTLTMFITALAFPILPLIIGILLNPETVTPMIIMLLGLGGPLAYFLFGTTASRLSVSFPNKLPKMERAYPAAGLIVGTILAIAMIFFLKQPPSIASMSIVIPFLIGLYIDFRKAYKEAAEVEKNIVIFLNAIADLVEVRSVGKALEYLIVEAKRAGGSRFSKEFMAIIERMAAYLQKGDPLSKADWFSGSWIMRFVQLVLAQIEAAGQRSKEVVKILSYFFSEYLVIVKTTRARLMMASGIMMSVPAVLVIVLSAALGIMTSASSFIAKSGFDIEAMMTQVGRIPVPKSIIGLITGKGIDLSVVNLVDFLIIEIGIVLSLASSKAMYGTLRAARVPLIMSIVIVLMLLLKPLFISIMATPIR